MPTKNRAYYQAASIPVPAVLGRNGITGAMLVCRGRRPPKEWTPESAAKLLALLFRRELLTLLAKQARQGND